MKRMLEKLINIVLSFIFEDEYIDNVKSLLEIASFIKAFYMQIIQYSAIRIIIKNENITREVRPKLRP